MAVGALFAWLLLGGTMVAADEAVEEGERRRSSEAGEPLRFGRKLLLWLLLMVEEIFPLEAPSDHLTCDDRLTFPPAELNETVICTNDHMEVLIPAAFFLNKVPPVYVWDLHLNDPECRGVHAGDDYVFSIRTNLSDCGTVTVSDDSHIMFMNTIHNNQSDVITRSYINITFVCRYPLSYRVQQPSGQNLIRVDVRSITLSTEDGNFSVSMLLFKDRAFQDRWTTVPALSLDQDIFVKVFMLPADLVLRIESCWATPNRDPFSNIQYTFIRDGCPLLEDRQTLGVLKNGEGADATFRIQMFKFVGGSYTDVFLHCNVQICHGGRGGVSAELFL
ncbi:alpha-tectorin isoform X2 [Oryzias melastigma]|uniref:alpha-tectorin isoform X2 n=1 Tax=Oryzias melastigma TaxID=30732 RepID=UPI00168CE418|nr:alpha-tectorin isoform X2 [Oryzias melastigma]